MAQYKLPNYQHTLIRSSIMWSINHFPSAMRSLNPSTRAKAIEIANQLLEQGKEDQQHVVSISVDEARRWARCERDWPSAQRQLFV